MAKRTAAKKAAKPVKKAASKPVKKAAKPATKAAPKKPAKPVKKAVAKPAPKKAVKKAASAKKVAAKPAPKKAVKPAGKAPAKPAAKAPAAKKAAPAKPAAKAAVKPVAKAPAAKKAAPAKPAPKPPAKPAPKPAAKAAPAAKPAPVEKPVAKAPVKKEEPKKTEGPKPLVTIKSAPNMPKAAPVVKKQVSTLESPSKERYSDSELEEFRQIINAKLDEARKDYDLLKQTLANTDNNGTEDTSPSFKMIEDGSETLSREETAQLAARQEKFIKHLEDALLRIRNKTYGICRVTGRLISKERLRLVPHATLSIEAKQQMNN
jgi:RNA polymerase-binding transcription factor DksA